MRSIVASIVASIFCLSIAHAESVPAKAGDAPVPGAVFRDCADCAEMVSIPAGRFLMGSSSAETTSAQVPDKVAVWEHPQHDVTLHAFAIGKYDVTRGEFAAFVQATGYDASGCYGFDGSEFKLDASKNWRSPGFDQTDRHPVVCVNYADAQAYAIWLSTKTGKQYRLPSEAEWEYAARAGTTSAWYWGNNVDPQCDYANGADLSAKDRYPGLPIVAQCRDGYVNTSPVGSFRANAWGLFDMAGNVFQWTSDCWNETYAGAPSDGQPWTSGNCEWRAIRGGSWHYFLRTLRLATRNASGTGRRDSNQGFRLARTLP